MLNRCIPRTTVAAALLLCTTTLRAQTTTLVQEFTITTQGPDSPAFRRNITHFTFDLRGSGVASPNFWTGSEIAVDVLGNGVLWHAMDQNLGDPNGGMYFPNNLLPPAAPLPPPWHTARYDTFLAGGQYQLGPVPPNPNLVGILSTQTRIRGLYAIAQEGPLPWTVPGQFALDNSLLARFTFQVPEGLALSLAQDADHPTVFARLVGRTTASNNPDGVPFDLTVYQAPEPATILLLTAGGAILMRRGDANAGASKSCR